MTAQIAVHGRLVAEPQSRITNSGKSMTFARLAVPLPCHTAESGETTLWIAVIAFGRQADALGKHHKGELVSVAGTMQGSQWTGQDGEAHSGWQIFADSVISARTVRPGGRKGQQGQATDALNRAKEQASHADEDIDQTPPFDDEVLF